MNLHEMMFGTRRRVQEYGMLVNPGERGIFDALVDGLTKAKGPQGSPGLPALLLLRVEDVVTSYFIVRRIESTLRTHGVFQAGETVSKRGAPAAKKDSSDDNSLESEPAGFTPETVVPALEAAAKARERYRKALNELEDALAKHTQTSSAAEGIASRIRGLMIASEPAESDEDPIAAEA